MNYFLDTEFVEDDERDVMPISLGIINEDGDNELYLEFLFDKERAKRHDFVSRVVLPLLEDKWADKFTDAQAALALEAYFPQDDFVQLWANFSTYDHLIFCRLWKGLLKSPPRRIRHCCMDLSQLYQHLGCPAHLVPPKPKNCHHALADAKWDRLFWLNLKPLALEKGLVL